MGLNNDYSADTKKLRIASIGYDNLWQLGHSVSLTFFTAPQQTDNAKVWSGSYSMPLSNRWSLQFSGYKRATATWPPSAAPTCWARATRSASARPTAWSRRASGTTSLTMGIDYKKFDETTRFGNNEELIPLKYLPFTFRTTATAIPSRRQRGPVDRRRRALSFGIGSGWKEFDG